MFSKEKTVAAMRPGMSSTTARENLSGSSASHRSQNLMRAHHSPVMIFWETPSAAVFNTLSALNGGPPAMAMPYGWPSSSSIAKTRASPSLTESAKAVKAPRTSARLKVARGVSVYRIECVVWWPVHSVALHLWNSVTRHASQTQKNGLARMCSSSVGSRPRWPLG
ncbi:hypothetical protein M885DRAFT_246460 [Pelagophyceae sp. CCMP2097]|nr:hypothetical protein M885DRAFT_246460 [Pelagophyceae sp. CCMP2097]